MAKRIHKDSLDRLSDLPEEIIDKVLKYVPLRDVVRTSALSKNWRYKWTHISSLVFDDRSIPPSPCIEGQTETEKPTETQRDTELASIINHVLLHHDGMIDRFQAQRYLDFGCADVDEWIITLERKSVKQLILMFNKGDTYKIPPSLFQCGNLAHLWLGHCVLKSPPQAKGFRNLISIGLYKVTFTDKTIASLLRTTPLLERLSLDRCKGFTRLNIFLSHLKMLYLKGCCKIIKFHKTRKLNYACISMIGSSDNGSRHRLKDVLKDLINIWDLRIHRHFMKFLAASTNIPARLPFTFEYLNLIQLSINFEDKKEILTAICLLSSSPSLRKLIIRSSTANTNGMHLEKGFWDTRRQEKEIMLPNLKTVRVLQFKGRQSELGFLQLLLMQAVLLETLNIRWKHNLIDDPELKRVLEETVQLKRASPTAQIIFLDPAT